MIDTIVTSLILIITAYFLIRSGYRSLSGKSKGCSGCSNNQCPLPKLIRKNKSASTHLDTRH